MKADATRRHDGLCVRVLCVCARVCMCVLSYHKDLPRIPSTDWLVLPEVVDSKASLQLHVTSLAL